MSQDYCQYACDNTNSSWSAQNFNGLTPTILAVDENGIEWDAEVSATGTFTFNLANGIYDFSGSEGEYNIEVIEDWEITNFVETQTLSMMADLQPVSVVIEVCLVKDVSGDCSEGIPKYAEMTITSQFDVNATYKLGESDFDEFGTYNLEIMPGRYTLQTTYTDSSDENATDFNMFFTTQDIFISMFAEDNEALLLILMMKDYSMVKSLPGKIISQTLSSCYTTNQTTNGCLLQQIAQVSLVNIFHQVIG